MSAALRRRLRAQVSSEVQCGYGTTETGAIAFSSPRDGDAEETVGRSLPGIEIRITGTDRSDQQMGTSGEVAIRCVGMFDGYRNQPELTAGCMHDGWFYTGDVGFIDAQQRLRLSGRSDDMFVFNSMNIYPQEIEAMLCQSPAIVDAAVLPKPSPVHGDVPVALVVKDSTKDFDLRALRRFAREEAGIRCPRQFTVVDHIPRNAAGKILRAEALALLNDTQGSGALGN